jgi:hypothetical protein
VLKAKPKASNRKIAKQVKADDKTVATVRRELEATAEIPQLAKTTGADGKERPAKRKRRDVEDFLAEKRAREASGEPAICCPECSRPATTPKQIARITAALEAGATNAAEVAAEPKPQPVAEPDTDTHQRHRKAVNAFYREMEADAAALGESYSRYVCALDLLDPQLHFEVILPIILELLDLPTDPWPGLTYDDLKRMSKGRSKEARSRNILPHLGGRMEVDLVGKIRAAIHRDWLLEAKDKKTTTRARS